MFYLFNSGYYPKYQTNILNTLNLPVGFTNKYRYTQELERNQIELNAKNKLEKHWYRLNILSKIKNFLFLKLITLNYESISKIISKIINKYDGMIIFIDRFDHTGYKFYPLRLLKVIGIENNGDKMVIHCILGNYIYPKDLEKYNIEIKSRLESFNLPKLTDNNPKNVNDGNYCICTEEKLKVEPNNFDLNDVAWDNIVKTLKVTDKFTNSTDSSFIFTKFSLQNSNNKKQITNIKLSGHDTYYKLKKGSGYNANIKCNYYDINNDFEKKQLYVSISDNISDISEKNLTIDSQSDVKSLKFVTKQVILSKIGRLNIIGDNGVYIYDNHIKFYIGNDPVQYFRIFLLMIIIFASSCILLLDFSTMGNNTLWEFVLNSTWNFGWLKGLNSLITAYGAFFALKYFGNKY